VLLACSLDDLAEVEELIECFTIEEVGEALTPTVLELYQDLNQFHVVL